MEFFAKNQPFMFGESIYPKGGQFGPLNQSYLDLVIMYEGEAEVVADGKTNLISTGEAALVYNEKFVLYQMPRNKQTRFIWCETGELLGSKSTITNLKALPFTLSSSERMEDLLWMGIKLGHSDGSNVGRLRNLLGEAVFYEYFCQANLIEDEGPLPKSIIKAKDFIEQHYTDHCTLEMVAESAGLNPHYLSRLFIKHLDYSPTDYIWQLRAEKGVRLLCQTGLTIAEIAYQCGFKNPYHFSRHIKKQYNHAPKEIRRRGWYRKPSPSQGQVPDVAY